MSSVPSSPRSPSIRMSSRREVVVSSSPRSEISSWSTRTPGLARCFETQRDAEITIGIYKRVPILWRDEPEENPWGLSFLRMFDMANDSGLFRTRDQLERRRLDARRQHLRTRPTSGMLPLYEAKLIHHFDHRFACYSKRREGESRH